MDPATTLDLNLNYTDTEGNTYEGLGDIVFTGATTKEDLVDAFTRWGVRGGITEELITLSRTSELNGTNTLYGGRLIVEAEAIIKGSYFEVENSAGATVKLDRGHTEFASGIAFGVGNHMEMKDGSALGGTISFGTGSTLQVTNLNAMGSLTMGDGSAFIFDLEGSSILSAGKPMLSVEGKLIQSGSLNVEVKSRGTVEGRRIALLSAGTYDKSKWTEGNVTVTGGTCGFEDLRWVDNVLYLWDDGVSCYYIGGDHEWDMRADNKVWSPDDRYKEESFASYRPYSDVTFEKAGNLTIRGEISVGGMTVRLSRPEESININMAGQAATLDIMEPLKLESGTLSISGGGDTLKLKDVEWTKPGGSVLRVTDLGAESPFTVDLSRAHFTVAGGVYGDSAVLLLDFEGADGKHPQLVYDKTNKYWGDEVHFVDFLMGQGLMHTPSFSKTSQAGAFVYDGDIYYGSHRGFSVVGNETSTWWKSPAGKRCEYDTEKVEMRDLLCLPENGDAKFCAGCTALNMYTAWLDKYAPLNASEKEFIFVPVPGASGSITMSDTHIFNHNGAYDVFREVYGGEHDSIAIFLQGLLSENAAFGRPFRDLFSSGFVGTTSPSSVDDIKSRGGEIHVISYNEGEVSPYASTMEAAVTLSKVIITGFEASKNAPLGVGYFIQQEDGDEKKRHVVTCWGYETSVIDGEEIVTRLKIKDSDDGSVDPQEVWYDIVYKDRQAYLVTVQDGHVATMFIQLKNTISAVFVLTTPSYADGMLERYNDPKVPIYWTGKGAEWKVDDTCMTYGDGTITSQKRLAGVSDGWRKLCEAEGHSTWAHSVFTGQESEIRFEDEVAGAKLTDAQKEVRTAGIDATGTKAVVAGSGFVFRPAGGGQTVPIRLAELELQGGSAALAPGVLLRAPVTLDAGTRLENNGVIADDVTMLGGSTFVSGCIQATPEGGTVVVDSGLAGASLVLSGDGRFTVGATLDVSRLGVWDYVMYKAGSCSVGDSFESSVNQMFQLKPGEGQTIQYEAVIIRADVRDKASAVAGGTQSFVAGCAFELSGGADEAITLGSGAVAEDSAAKLVLSGVEGQGSRIVAAEADFATVAGESVSLGADTVVSAKIFTVAGGSSLSNNGRIEVADSLQVAGTLAGDGAFGATVVESGGTVQAGAATYGDLTVESGGTLAFNVDGTPSVLHINEGGSLTVEDGAAVSVRFTDSFLGMENLGKAQALSLVTLDSPADAALVQALQESTTFRQISTDGTATPLDDLHMQVRRFQWTASGGTLALDVTVGYIHDSELTWGDYDRNMTWDTTSANWAGGGSADGVFDYGYTCRFTDTGAGHVTLAGRLDPDAVVVDSRENYTFRGDGSLIGEASLTKRGRGVLEISTANTYTGGTVVEDGTLRFGNVRAAGTGAIGMRYGALDLNSLAVDNDINVHDGCVMLERAGKYAGTLDVSSGIVYLYGDVGGTMAFSGNCILSATDMGFDALTLGTLRFAEGCEVMLDFGYLRNAVEVGSQYTLFTTSGGEVDTSHFSLINSGLREGTYSFHCADGKVALSIDMASTVTLRWLGAKGVWSAGGDKEWEFVDGPPSDNRFHHGDAVLFDTAAKVSISGSVEPESVAVRVMGKDTLTFTGKGGIGGFSSVSIEGSGTLKLNATNSYTGGTVINSGTVRVTGIDSLGRGAVSLEGGTLDLGGKALFNAISASGGLLSGAGKYAGALTVDGALELKGTAHAATLTLESGTLSGGSLKDTAVSLGGGTISSAISGKSSVTVRGGATLSGKLSYSGTTTILDGATLRLEGSAAKPGKGGITLAGGTLAADVTLGSKQTLTVGGGAISGDLTLGGGTIRLAEGAQLDISGNLAVAKATKLDVSMLDTSATVTFASLSGDLGKKLTLTAMPGGRRSYTLDVQGGHFTVSVGGEKADLTWQGAKGKWEVLGKQVWEGGSTDNRFHHGDSVTFSSAAKVTLAGKLAPGDVVVLGDGAVTFSGSGSITGNASLSMSGSNTLKLNASNSYTGGTSISGGTVVASGAASFGTGAVELNGGTLDFAGKAVANDVMVGGTAAIRNGKAFAGTVTLSSGGVLGLDAGLSGTLVLDGGTLDLSGLSAKNLSKLKFGSVATQAVTTINLGDFVKSGYGSYKIMTLKDTTQLDVLKLRVAGMEDLRGVRPMFHLEGHDLVLTIYAYAESAPLDGDDGAAVQEASGDGHVVAAAPAPMPRPQIPGAAVFTTQMRAQIDGNRAAFDSIRQMMGNTQPTTADGKYRFAAQATNADSHQDGYDRNGFGGLVMAEQVFSDKAMGGLSLGYEHADIRPEGASKYESDDTRVNAHLLVSTKHWQSRSIAGVGIHDYRINRSSAVSTGHSLNLMEEVSRTIALNERNIVSPFVRVETGYNTIGSCNDGALTVNKQHAWATDLTFGARYVHGFRYGTLMLEAGATKSIGDLGGNVTVNNTALTPVDAKRWSATLGGSVQIPVGKRSSFNAGANVRLHGGATEVNANVGYGIRF